MRSRTFLDTNVFIYGFEFQESNSAAVLQLLNEGRIEGVVTERVLDEVMEYFNRHHDKDLAALFRLYLFETCTVVPGNSVEDEMDDWRGEIKEKDLEQLAAVKASGIKYLVSYDEDFEPFDEYYTPKEFVAEMGLEPEKTEY